MAACVGNGKWHRRPPPASPNQYAVKVVRVVKVVKVVRVVGVGTTSAICRQMLSRSPPT